MHIIAHARPGAHITPTRRIVASYVGTVAGLRVALADATQTRPTATIPAGGAR